MPFTDEFNKVRNHFKNIYSDKARAETFAFKKAFELNIPTFQKRRKNFKKNKESIFDFPGGV